MPVRIATLSAAKGLLPLGRKRSFAALRMTGDAVAAVGMSAYDATRVLAGYPGVNEAILPDGVSDRRGHAVRRKTRVKSSGNHYCDRIIEPARECEDVVAAGPADSQGNVSAARKKAGVIAP